MAAKITTYREAFWAIKAPLNENAYKMIRRLEKQGHTEKGVSFAIWRERDNIISHKGEPNFLQHMEQEIRKWSWPIGDPRWNDYWARKAEEEKAKKIDELVDKEEIKQNNYFGKHKVLDGLIYVIQGESGGPMKIGYTKDLQKRIATLQTGYPDNLKVVLTFPGSLKIEQKIHNDLTQYRMRGEWFKPEQYVFNRIELYKKRIDNLIQTGKYIKWRDRDQIKAEILRKEI